MAAKKGIISKPEDIDATDVLGMFMWRTKNPGSVPPAFCCLGPEARAENRKLAEEIIAAVHAQERARASAREAGDPRAYFAH